MLVQEGLFYFFKKPLCSVIVHICNIYVNRKENIGIMKPMKVMLCHLTATICSSPKGLMFKSLMKKKIVSYNVKLFLQRDEYRKSLPCTRKCNVMESLNNVNVFMRLWTDMAFLVLVLALYMWISKCMWCVKEGFIFLIVQNKSGKDIWKWIVWILLFKREVVPVHDTWMKWKINEYNLKFKTTNVRK